MRTLGAALPLFTLCEGAELRVRAPLLDGRVNSNQSAGPTGNFIAGVPP